MTVFIVVCAAMVAAALVWLIVPMFRKKAAVAAGEEHRRVERFSSAAVIAILIPALAVAMYSGLSNWDWKTVETQAAQGQQFDDLLKQLEARLQSNPDDLNGWLLLGRSYVSLQRFALAIGPYQRAYDLSRGENVDAVIGLAEALTLSDETALKGRAGELFEQALARAPNHPKALWYSGMAALQAGDLRKGRDRLQLLLAQSPPEELRSVLERQVQDLNQQLGETTQVAQATGEPTPATPPTGKATSAAQPAGEGVQASARSIRVSVSIAPAIKQKLTEPLSLFVLARDPAGGPPLAAQRHSSSELPLTVTLTERDAMMPTRTIATASRVQVVARLSRSGTPQAQTGDFFGQADYEFGKTTGTLNILIDQVVP